MAHMDFAGLYELADRELDVGLGVERLIDRSMAEANGVEGHARQIYCELRAKELARSEDEDLVGELVAEIEMREGLLRARKERHRWFWALAAVGGMIATSVSTVLAQRALVTGGRFFPLATLTLVLFTLTIVALVASRYHTDTD